MNAFIGPYSTARDDSWASGQNSHYATFRQWLKTSEVPLPSHFWTLIEEHPDSINDGYFLNNPVTATSWGGLPASFHNGAANIAFVDGHTEMHMWLSRATKRPVAYLWGGVQFDTAGRSDYRWLIERTAVPLQN